MAEVYGVIYLLIDGTNDMEYVGQTTRPVEVRFRKHAQCKTTFIGRAIRAHGKDMFVVAILKECYSREELDYWERHFIRYRGTMKPNGYNLTEGGEGSWKHTAATRERISKKTKGLPKTPEHCAKIAAALRGVNSPFFGTHHSQEQCFQRSLVQRTNSPYKNLLSEMDERQLSYTALAKLLSLSTVSISLKMCGEIHFMPKDIENLVELFGKPAEYLLERDDGLSAVASETETSIKKSVGHRIDSPFKILLAAIDERQLTYTALAEGLGLSVASISAKIRGKLKFLPAQMEAIRNFLGVEMSVEELFKRAE